jgi:precorrin-8X/cobalt-precorrin-8 methylmutase
MEWHVTDAQSLILIDREVGEHHFSPAEYEIVRRVIYATADFEYKFLVRFSSLALQSGAAALAARTTIIVDTPLLQLGMRAWVQHTFANPVFSSLDALPTVSTEKSRLALGMEAIARRYPEAIFVIGQSQAALLSLLALVEAEEIRPALIVATPASFIEVETTKVRLCNSLLPHIYIEGRKGNAAVAAAIVEGLIDLAWQAYGQ